MASTIGFETVQAYLDALAEANQLLGNSPHGAFWRVAYQDFVDGHVPGVTCNAVPVPIIRKDAPAQSPFFLIMTDPGGWCGKRQMPGGGPFISQDDLQLLMADGTTIVTGKQVREDLATWLKNGFPKAPTPIP